MPKNFSLCKDERLYLREAISDLFAKGSSFTVFPYRVMYHVLPEDDPQVARVAIMTIAPKKKFKHAVDRNRTKRLIREAYRLNKQLLLNAPALEGRKLDLAFIWLSDDLFDYPTIENKIKILLQRIAETL